MLSPRPHGLVLQVKGDAAPGKRLGVLMRPERFSASGDNAFAGEVLEAIYLGASFKLRLRCESGIEILVRQPARGRLLMAGERLTVSIDADELHFEIDPTIAAVSVMQILLVAVVLFLDWPLWPQPQRLGTVSEGHFKVAARPNAGRGRGGGLDNSENAS